MNSFQKEISEWSNNELCNWLNSNNYRGIADLFQKYSLTGYDIFYLNDKILKEEFISWKISYIKKVTQFHYIKKGIQFKNVFYEIKHIVTNHDDKKSWNYKSSNIFSYKKFNLVKVMNVII